MDLANYERCKNTYFSTDVSDSDGLHCVDKNECEENICTSYEICKNTPGSWQCECPPLFYRPGIVENDFLNQKMNLFTTRKLYF